MRKANGVLKTEAICHGGFSLKVRKRHQNPLRLLFTIRYKNEYIEGAAVFNFYN
ncbi:hypothetical protein [Metabacillus indicus]|uniref:hypothetical protein n=1 Tax=Metabacillus indicus TaxID=246786 RepID=UPI0019D37B55|nr:hypothetical protein [Metabacillus indicus]